MARGGQVVYFATEERSDCFLLILSKYCQRRFAQRRGQPAPCQTVIHQVQSIRHKNPGRFGNHSRLMQKRRIIRRQRSQKRSEMATRKKMPFQSPDPAIHRSTRWTIPPQSAHLLEGNERFRPHPLRIPVIITEHPLPLQLTTKIMGQEALHLCRNITMVVLGHHLPPLLNTTTTSPDLRHRHHRRMWDTTRALFHPRHHIMVTMT